ncbi:GNAT family N-acetyltransferase [candidate division GN15 bacterium]|nr:GNAT family N-acetyltransferase [candidate division GN15 bacterium]
MIRYESDTSAISPDDLQGFFVGWPNPPSAETHLGILKGSDHVVLAREDSKGRVVGFVTAITDGVLAAYLPLLEVLPEYQGRGIGGELVRRMLAQLDGLYMIDAVCDDDVVPFYQEFGMVKATAVARRDYDAQNGRKRTG